VEGFTLKHGMIDAAAQCVRFKNTKSGKQNRAFGRGAIENFTAITSKNSKASDIAFPELSGAGHVAGLPKKRKRVAAPRGLKDVPLRGLRHWYVSAATEPGHSDLIIGDLLGHAQKSITGRHATAPDPALVRQQSREKGNFEPLNGELRDELLNGKVLHSPKEARIVIEQWRNDYNTIRPHSSMDYRPPAPQTYCPFPPARLDARTPCGAGTRCPSGQTAIG
jgi:hypothetical protein